MSGSNDNEIQNVPTNETKEEKIDEDQKSQIGESNGTTCYDIPTTETETNITNITTVHVLPVLPVEPHCCVVDANSAALGDDTPTISTIAEIVETEEEESSNMMTLPVASVKSDNIIETMQKPEPQTTITIATADDVTTGTAGKRIENDRPWDFSNRKVMIQGVDKFHDVKTATKMIHKWLESTTTATTTTTTTTSNQLHPPFIIDKIKKPPKSNWLLITLQNESMVQPFIAYMNTSNFKNRKGDTVFAKVQQQQQQQQSSNDRDINDKDVHGNNQDRKRHRTDDISDNNNNKNEIDNKNDDDFNIDDELKSTSKRQRQSTTSTTNATTIARRPISIDELKNRIIPLWNLSVPEQVQYKMKDMIKKCAMKIIIDIKNKFRALEKEKSRSKLNVYPWILQQRCVDIQTIVTAPTPLRNKCELTFGYQYMFPKAITTTEIDVIGSESDGNVMENSVPEELMADVVGATDKADVVTTAAITDIEPMKIPAVGFMVTGWAGGVSFSDTLSNIPYEVSSIVEIINQFLLTSPLVPYDCSTHTGFWRILTIRTSRRTKECMIIIQHNSTPKKELAVSSGAISGTDTQPVNDADSTLDAETIVANEKERLIALLTNTELPTTSDQSLSTTIKVTSIFFQEFSGLSNPPPEHPVQHAYGTTYLTEQLGDCKFQISPGAFFQVNTEGAEILYSLVVDKVREVSLPDPTQTLLFDVCCGTGTIGITCLKAGVVGQVVGVDISEPAIADANRNAVLNGYTTSQSDNDNSLVDVPNTRFVASRAELVLGREIQNAKQRQRQSDDDNGTTTKKEMKFVAVVDPAREGLHADVVKAIRSNQRISRLIYVSCNPTVTLVRDAALFCSPPTKRYTGRPFRITSAQPVDMFPLTNHCEMVMTFDRLTEEEM